MDNFMSSPMQLGENEDNITVISGSIENVIYYNDLYLLFLVFLVFLVILLLIYFSSIRNRTSSDKLNLL